MGDVIHIHKEKAYGRQGKAPTGLNFAEAYITTHTQEPQTVEYAA